MSEIAYKAFDAYKKDKYKTKVYFKVSEDNGDIKLQATDEDGKTLDCGNILTICKDGTVILHAEVSPYLGLSLNENGQLKFLD